MRYPSKEAFISFICRLIGRLMDEGLPHPFQKWATAGIAHAVRRV